MKPKGTSAATGKHNTARYLWNKWFQTAPCTSNSAEGVVLWALSSGARPQWFDASNLQFVETAPVDTAYGIECLFVCEERSTALHVSVPWATRSWFVVCVSLESRL